MMYDPDGNQSPISSALPDEEHPVETSTPAGPLPADARPVSSPSFAASSASSALSSLPQVQPDGTEELRLPPDRIGELFHWRTHLQPARDALREQRRSLQSLQEQLRAELHNLPAEELSQSVRRKLDYFASSLENEERELQRIHTAVEELDQLLQSLPGKSSEINSSAGGRFAEGEPSGGQPLAEETLISAPRHSRENRAAEKSPRSSSPAKEADDTVEPDIFERLFGAEALETADPETAEVGTPAEETLEEDSPGADEGGAISAAFDWERPENHGADGTDVETDAEKDAETHAETDAELQVEGGEKLSGEILLDHDEPPPVGDSGDLPADTSDTAESHLSSAPLAEGPEETPAGPETANDEKLTGCVKESPVGNSTGASPAEVLGEPPVVPLTASLTAGSAEVASAEPDTNTTPTASGEEQTSADPAAADPAAEEGTTQEAALEDAVAEIQSVLTEWFASDEFADSGNDQPAIRAESSVDGNAPQAAPTESADFPREGLFTEIFSGEEETPGPSWPEESPSAASFTPQAARFTSHDTEPAGETGPTDSAGPDENAEPVNETEASPHEKATDSSVSGIELISAKWLKQQIDTGESAAEKADCASQPAEPAESSSVKEGALDTQPAASGGATFGEAQTGENSSASSLTEADLDDATNPDTIAAYMQRLLQSQRPAVSHFQSDPVFGKKPSAATDDPAAEAGSETDFSGVSVPEISSPEPSEPATQTSLPQPPAPLDSAPRIDKESIRAGIASMRELANQQARQALAVHRWSRCRRLIFMKALLAIVSGLGGLLLLTSELWSPQSLVELAWPVVALAGVLAVDCFRTIGRFRCVLRPDPTRPANFLERICRWNLSIRTRFAAAIGLLSAGTVLANAEGWSSLSLTGYGWSAWALSGALFLDLFHAGWERLKRMTASPSRRPARPAGRELQQRSYSEDSMADPELGLPRAHFTDDEIQADVMSVFLSSELPALSPEDEEQAGIDP